MSNRALAEALVEKMWHHYQPQSEPEITEPDDEDMGYLVHMLEHSDTPDVTHVALFKSPGFNMSVLEENGYLAIDTYYDGGTMDTPSYPRITKVVVTKDGFEAAISYLSATYRKETA